MFSRIEEFEHYIEDDVDECEFAQYRYPENKAITGLRRFLPIFVAGLLLLVTVQAMIVSVAVVADEERIFRLGSAGVVQEANPYIGVMDEEYIYYGMVFDYLTFPNKDGVATPNLANSWWFMNGTACAAQDQPTIFDSADFPQNKSPSDWPLGSIWEYNITPDVYWNDGELFTAYDVEWTFNLQIGENFMAYWAYQPVTRWVHHAEAVSADKVRIFFSDFRTSYPMSVAWGYSLSVPIMAKHYFEDKTSTYIAYSWDGVPSIGTGIFMGTDNMKSEIFAGERLTLIKNPYYDFTEDGVRKGLGGYHNRTVEIDKLIMKFFTEETTLSLAVQTGEVDAAEIMAITYVNWIENPDILPDHVNLVSMLSGTVYSKQIVLNVYEQSTGELNLLRFDPAVVRATELATNKSQLIKNVYKDLGLPGYGLISPVWPEWYWNADDTPHTFYVNDSAGVNLFNYTKPIKNAMDYDIDLANDILDAAGYEWTGTIGNSVRKAGQVAAERMAAMFGGTIGTYLDTELTFELILYNEVFEDRQSAEILEEEWNGAGIKAEKNLLDMATRNSRVYSYNWESMITYWSADVDPNYILYIPTSYAIDGWNEFGTVSDDYDYYYDK